MISVHSSMLLLPILDTNIAANVTTAGFFLILFSSIVTGILFSGLYVFNRRNQAMTPGLALAIVLVPVAVSIVVLMVGRNIATGLGLSGIFVLVRFRSGPVETKDLAYLFVSICCGVINGVGYVGYALLFALIMLLVIFVLEMANWGGSQDEDMLLKIWVPETLNFQGEFDNVLKKHCKGSKLLMVRTTDFGSMCELRYRIRPRNGMDQKKLIDDIRVKNGNMNVVLIVAPSIVERSSKQVL